jgi:hypothetical protein
MKTPDALVSVRTEQGIALLTVVLIMLLLFIIGTVSVNLATHEIQQASGVADEVMARHLAEAGTELVMSWFHDPSSVPPAIGGVIRRQHDAAGGGLSYFDALGRSQFTGSSANPDIAFDASRPSDDRLLNDPKTGWFRELQALGRVNAVKVYAPGRPGFLCTIEVTAQAKQVARTVSLQLRALKLSPLRAAVQIQNKPARPAATPLPLWLHWGDANIGGNALLGTPEDVPAKSALASVTGQSYGEMAPRLDRWVDIFVGGEALFSPSASPGTIPSNVYAQQDPVPGLRWTEWDYDTLKKYAVRYGSYYIRGQDGLLYRDGTVQEGAGRQIDEVLRSREVGDDRRLVFIDTLDQRPPGPDNLGTLDLSLNYAEGFFIVNANVRLVASGAGMSVPALSPPDERSSSLATRIPVTLPGIHLRGVLFTPGDMVYEGRPRVYGALLIGGGLQAKTGTPAPLEVWYDNDLGDGLFRGLPLVYPASGTWQETY